MIKKEENKEYLPMQGLDSFRKATVDLLLGKDNAAIKEARCHLCSLTAQARERASERAQERGSLSRCAAGFGLASVCVQGRVACLQSLSGTGSLRVGAQFIQKWLPGKTMCEIRRFKWSASVTHTAASTLRVASI